MRVEASTPKRGVQAALSAIVCLRRGQCFPRLLQEDAALLMFATSRFWVIASTLGAKKREFAGSDGTTASRAEFSDLDRERALDNPCGVLVL
jgi:hypothetical protein